MPPVHKKKTFPGGKRTFPLIARRPLSAARLQNGARMKKNSDQKYAGFLIVPARFREQVQSFDWDDDLPPVVIRKRSRNVIRIASHPDFGKRRPKLKRGQTGAILVFGHRESLASV
ncbi:hypothetical protein ACLJYM_10785 [Rhizobium giardinii]|uniref:hypothetical protein n=1 Tax=Rhizobium giardinii TaxID=56731 RepID=UPI0039E0F712